ncbi:SMR family transporter [Adlercreutzia sp. ZJ141]|uniref:SMR family transporter n=1 Tax=Adlercreutzia sp. ZJ141 TaxID=2709406 RepID=UPI0013EBE124|nr:SMR family transporter [Adlercreutzia sp. ZJ141]
MSPIICCFAALNLLGVFISSVSQVMLKKSASKEHSSVIKEYANPAVMGAYVLFLASTLLSVFAYKVIPLSMGAILDATGYIYITLFGVLIFREKLNKRRVAALALILIGIVVYSMGLG